MVVRRRPRPRPGDGAALRRQTMRGGYRTKKDAEKALGVVLGDAQAGTFRRLLGTVSARSSSRSGYRRCVHGCGPRRSPRLPRFATKYVQPRIGATPIAALTAASLQRVLWRAARPRRPRWKAARSEDGSPRAPAASIRTALSDTLPIEDMVAGNVAEAADPPAVHRPEMHVWTADELGAFLTSTAGDRLAMWLLLRHDRATAFGGGRPAMVSGRPRRRSSRRGADSSQGGHRDRARPGHQVEPVAPHRRPRRRTVSPR